MLVAAEPAGAMVGAVTAGAAAPLGATVSPAGVHFSLFSSSATPIDLLLFDDGHAPQPARVIARAARLHRTYYHGHAQLFSSRSGFDAAGAAFHRSW